jgi:Tfp pilus assembly protein PilF
VWLIAPYLVIPPAAFAQDALWRSYYTSAQRQYQEGNYAEARKLLDSAQKAAFETDETLSTYFYLAHVCVRSEQYQDAENYYKIVLNGLGTKAWAVLRPPDGTPEWEQNSEKVENATDSKHFLAILDKKPPQLLAVKLAKPITIVDVLSDYGTMLQMTKRYEEAEQAYRQALILSDCRPDQATNYEARLLQKLQVLYDLEGRTADKESVGRQLAMARNDSMPDFDALVNQTIKRLDQFGRNPLSLAIRLNNLALFCATHGDYGRAETLFNRSLSCLNDHPVRGKKDRQIILSNYCDLLLAMGRVAEANNLGREVSALASISDSSDSDPATHSH